MGITRDTVIQMPRDLGYEVPSRAPSLEDLADADEAFFTGPAAEVTPIREVDGALINGGQRGPVTQDIQRVFFSAVAGRDERYRDWLHFVTLQTVGHR